MNRLLTLIFASLAIVPGTARAEYPSKAITLIVPYAAGGSNDTLSRILAEHMSKTLGRPIIIDNEPGAARHHRDHARGSRGSGWLHHHNGQYGDTWRSAGAVSRP